MARGGTGGVYRSIDQRLERTVALKIMHPHLTEDPTFVGKFAKEARAAARLSHPNVVAVLDQGETNDGLVYLVMEYVEGGTLRDVLNRKKFLTPSQAFEILRPMLDGLSHAHEAGLIHRDIKPENVLMRTDGTVKIADFGLSRGADQHTATGAVLGTVAYAAPELVLEQPVGTRSDVYSMGILAWEMLAGRRPFNGTPWSLVRAHVEQGVPPLHEAVPGIDQSIAEMIRGWTAKEQQDRPENALVLAQELARLHQNLSSEALEHIPSGWSQGPGPLAPVLADPGTSVLPESAPSTGPVDDIRSATSVPTEVYEPENFQENTASTEALSTTALHHDSRPLPPELGVFDDTTVISNTDSHHDTTTALPTPSTPPKPQKTSPYKPTVQLMNLSPIKIVVAVFITALLVCLAAFLGWLLGPGSFRTATVPTVQGNASEQAELAAQDLGFTNVRVYEQSHADIPAGAVIKTNPAAGATIRVDEELSIIVSSGPAQVTVPDLDGLTQDQATKRLKESDLVLGAISTEFSDAPKDTVIASSPAHDTEVVEGTAINITLSAGAQPAQVPNVVGSDISQATLELEKLGFTVNREDLAGATLGRVVSQTETGTTVTLQVI